MTKTINLTGAEVAVTGLDGAHAHIRNDGTDTIYAAKTAGITAGADGVASIPAGQDFTLCGISGTVHLLGTGSVQLVSNDYVPSPFGDSTASGGSAVDEVARAAINAHSGNAEKHVTAAEKAAWDGKAELTDIPTSLPADGGNADTIDGWHSSDFVFSSRNGWTQYPIPNNVDVPVWLAENGNYFTQYFTNIGLTGLTNCPNPNEWIWYYRIGNLIIAQENASNRVWVSQNINGVFSGWSQINSSDFVLKTDYDALAARVAALEGGTT